MFAPAKSAPPGVVLIVHVVPSQSESAEVLAANDRGIDLFDDRFRQHRLRAVDLVAVVHEN